MYLFMRIIFYQTCRGRIWGLDCIQSWPTARTGELLSQPEEYRTQWSSWWLWWWWLLIVQTKVFVSLSNWQSTNHWKDRQDKISFYSIIHKISSQAACIWVNHNEKGIFLLAVFLFPPLIQPWTWAKLCPKSFMIGVKMWVKEQDNVFEIKIGPTFQGLTMV